MGSQGSWLWRTSLRPALFGRLLPWTRYRPLLQDHTEPAPEAASLSKDEASQLRTAGLAAARRAAILETAEALQDSHRMKRLKSQQVLEDIAARHARELQEAQRLLAQEEEQEAAEALRREEEHQRLLKEQEAARRREEEQQRLLKEQEAARRREEEQQRLLKEQEAARRREEEQQRLLKEQEAARRREEEQQRLLKEQEAARRREEEQQRLLKEQEAARRREEEQRLLKEQEDRRLKDLEQCLQTRQEDRRRAEEQRLSEEAACRRESMASLKRQLSLQVEASNQESLDARATTDKLERKRKYQLMLDQAEQTKKFAAKMLAESEDQDAQMLDTAAPASPPARTTPAALTTPPALTGPPALTTDEHQSIDRIARESMVKASSRIITECMARGEGQELIQAKLLQHYDEAVADLTRECLKEKVPEKPAPRSLPVTPSKDSHSLSICYSTYVFVVHEGYLCTHLCMCIYTYIYICISVYIHLNTYTYM